MTERLCNFQLTSFFIATNYKCRHILYYFHVGVCFLCALDRVKLKVLFIHRGESSASRLGRFPPSPPPGKLLPLHVKYEAGRFGEKTSLLYCTRICQQLMCLFSVVQSAVWPMCRMHSYFYISYIYIYIYIYTHTQGGSNMTGTDFFFL